MGFFTRPNGSGVLPMPHRSLSVERIAAVLDSQGWACEPDEDGDMSGRWNGHQFYFLRLGPDEQIFMVQGRWNAYLPLGMEAEVLPVLNAWHRTHFSPKAVCVDAPDDGASRVFTDVNLDCGRGVSDAQLVAHIKNAIGASLCLFGELAERFPGLPTDSD